MEQENQNRGIAPKNYLVESILVTIFCCLPFGIAGIVNATKVESLYAAGDVAGAEAAAANAKKWMKIGFIVGIVVGVLTLLGYGGMMMAVLSSGALEQ